MSLARRPLVGCRSLAADHMPSSDSRECAWMRLLILGGTQFLGRAIAAHAVANGHDVTCAARGVTGAVASGARLIRVDRDKPDGLAPLSGEAFDAVVDVSRHPGQVRRALAALKERVAHWTLVSTVSVYADNA